MQLARQLRRQGVECMIEFKERSLKSQLSRANKLDASWVVIVGDEEIKKGKYKIKEMATSLQKEGNPQEILKIIKEST
jgi:histidyl-tRNA synthetase